MPEFVFRYLSLTIIVFVVLFQSYLSNDPMVSLIIILTIILLSYFLVPLSKKPILNYLLIVSVFPVAAFLNQNLEYLLLLYIFILIEGTFKLKAREYIIFIVCFTVLSVIFSILMILPLNSLMLFILLAFCTILLNRTVNDGKEKSEMYEQLLLHYRRLKRLSVEQEELVRAEERTKIARDMHDSVGHKLTALLMQLEMFDIQNPNPTVQNLKELARDSLEETRYAVRQLKLNETSGIQSVIQLIRKLEMESHLIIKFTLEKGILSIPLSNDQSIVLYRVLQESLTNAMKHSDSKEVEVTLTMNSLQHVHFSVKNKIFTHYPIVQGFGLTNMNERLQEIGGNLRTNKTEQHFIVEGTFPLRRE